jgi:hypothetical protein
MSGAGFAQTLQTIQTILAPVVMVTSCAILVGGMLAQYGAINDRLRAMSRERLDLLHAPDGTLSAAAAAGDALKAERLLEIGRQVPDLLRRHELVHNAVLATYAAMVAFVASMFAIGAAAIVGSGALAIAALCVFLAGTAVMLAGIVLFAVQVRISHWAVHYEVRRVMGLGG